MVEAVLHSTSVYCNSGFQFLQDKAFLDERRAQQRLFG